MPSTTWSPSSRPADPGEPLLPAPEVPNTPSPPGAGVEILVERLGRRFVDPDLLARALAHRSWCAETEGALSNERLEFLGDAVLGLVVTDHLFRSYPDLPEGELAKVRASLVNSEALAEVAAEIELGSFLLLGKGEAASGGREKPSILADAMEAVIGAVYIDGGWLAAAELIMRLLAERIDEAAAGPGGQDFKTRLQELAARRFDQLPRYTVLDEGPDHAKRFFATVFLAGRERGRGEGRSKKQAEQGAARAAWIELQRQITEELAASSEVSGSGGEG
ncbi:MAG: ribonuclease III [Actinobacteria bacterium]|nr:ribonuclease III [Actinomycetota bacterium]